MTETRLLASTIGMVVDLVDIAAECGDGPELHRLRRRALALLDPPKPSALRARQVSIDREHASWVRAITELLLPAQRDAVVKALRSDREGEDGGLIIEDPWDVLDPDVRRAREQVVAARIARGEHAAIVACLGYESTRRSTYLREAVNVLESAIRAEGRRPSGPPEAACGTHRDRLGRALYQELPPSAFRFFVTVIRDDIAQFAVGTDRKSVGHGSELEQWFSREDWTVARFEERAVGVWFVDQLQDRYDEEMERERLAEESQERAREEAKEKVRKWEEDRDARASRERAAEKAKESASAKASSKRSRERKARAIRTQGKAVRFSPDLGPRLEADYKTWPVHAEENARYIKAATQKSVEEWAEHVGEQDLLASKEVDRIKIEAAKEALVGAMKAKAARKASPARIQSRD